MMGQGRMQPQPLPSSTMAIAGAAVAPAKDSATKAQRANFCIAYLPFKVARDCYPVSTQHVDA